METLYRKVQFEINCKDHDETWLIGKSANFIFNPNTRSGEELSDFLAGCEEIPDPTAQLQADKAELLELRSTIEEFRDKANQSADNLHKRGLQSSGMCSQAMETAYNLCLIEIESLIQKMKKCQENTPR